MVAGLRDGKIETTDEIRGPNDAEWQAIENHPDLAEIAEEVEPPLPRFHEEPTSLDMNPLIDVCLVLLVFFILTTSYAVAVLKVIPLEGRDPRSGIRKVNPSDVKKEMIRVQATQGLSGKLAIRIENQGRDVLDAAGRLDSAKLEAAFRDFTRGADRKTQVLLDSRGIDWGTVVAIQDAAKAAGVQTVNHALHEDPAKR